MCLTQVSFSFFNIPTTSQQQSTCTKMDKGFPGSSDGKRLCLQCRRPQFYSWVGKTPWKKDRLPTLVVWGCPCGSVSKESTCNLGDLDLIPGLGRSPGGGHGDPLQYSCLENSQGQKSLVGHNRTTKHITQNGQEWENLIQMTFISTTVGKNPLEEME